MDENDEYGGPVLHGEVMLNYASYVFADFASVVVVIIAGIVAMVSAVRRFEFPERVVVAEAKEDLRCGPIRCRVVYSPQLRPTIRLVGIDGAPRSDAEALCDPMAVDGLQL